VQLAGEIARRANRNCGRRDRTLSTPMVRRRAPRSCCSQWSLWRAVSGRCGACHRARIRATRWHRSENHAGPSGASILRDASRCRDALCNARRARWTCGPERRRVNRTACPTMTPCFCLGGSFKLNGIRLALCPALPRWRPSFTLQMNFAMCQRDGNRGKSAILKRTFRGPGRKIAAARTK
jgi:hypothetical protein